MVLPLALRTSLLLVAGGLAACASSGGGSGGGPEPERASVMLISRTSPTLALMNIGTPVPPAPNGNDIVAKMVEPAGMAALVETFGSEDMFRFALADAPTGARQALVLDRDGKRSVWVFTGNARDPGYVTFVQARNYFLQLFNHARNYVPDEQAKQDLKESREFDDERRRRQR
jgi:hypothetical protein